MWFANDMFRLSYLPNVIIPILFAVFSSSNLSIVNVMPYIVGWSFIMTYANLLNDAIDQDRKLPIGRKSLTVLLLVFIIFSLVLLRNHILYVLIAIIGWALYDWKIKGVPFLDIALLISLGLIPYIAISDFVDFNIITVFVGFGVVALLVDKIVDEPKYKGVSKISSKILILTSISLSIFLMYINVVAYSNYWYILPLIPFLLGIAILFTFLKKYIKSSIKIIAVYSGNVLMFYLFALLIEMGKFI